MLEFKRKQKIVNSRNGGLKVFEKQNLLGKTATEEKKRKALKLVLDFESTSKFWGFRWGTSLYYLPTSCRIAIVMQATNQKK